MLIFKTASPEQTFDFGRQLAQWLKPGFVVCLQGDLGAGKTLLVQGIAAGLGIGDAVTSPTFTILNVYPAEPPVYHFDLYRLEQAEELFDIGFYEYIDAGGIAVIEWPDKFTAELPDEFLWLELKPGDSTTERLIVAKAEGLKYQSVCEELKNIAGSCFRYGYPCV
ncbi:tRNA (adenosine(37)-N6)-threonylcarbamoyltransferase complex ATPase subunit type 1 TsaE|uniref:tRNA threonylcarbamoyladenosine biosynthesis protein TsaE n=1 Tax=Dendrosporobacter quercicolus TaxID=146817 RepID=A0A1G9Y9D3_9FIRM|nr:tRNA (adenosine(37)-N6)-threonylcarbamoyltransferase complex ATPase subunit type 1 TsaE [Dendrosporobacter quercicolus]NSL47564.1 tRNA (adenosine(37)-N6)-threonylcarbamoyltransferase complex ATPase subunit type 1 TsaE [Dendrosporobacter quercicolus DSM 1736]SDN05145.1 tRNA threonylcarbamoyladenosine biosynthesis protein TsaE [Dendrosporobacter quercicolus]